MLEKDTKRRKICLGCRKELQVFTHNLYKDSESYQYILNGCYVCDECMEKLNKCMPRYSFTK